MTNVLEKIIAEKRKEVAARKVFHPVNELQARPLFAKPVLSLEEFLLRADKTGIIAEFKRRSPSKGVINDHSLPGDVVRGYRQHGASAVSVLTDATFFGGSLDDLEQAAAIVDIPLLRKDFIVDPYQLFESRAYGADVILLIAACLTSEEVRELAEGAKMLGLNVLLEVHDVAELDRICDAVDIVGINNRDLKTFKVDINHSIELAKKIPSHKIKISESGIDDVATIGHLRQNGFRGFLIGERFMRENDPAAAFGTFLDDLKSLLR